MPKSTTHNVNWVRERRVGTLSTKSSDVIQRSPPYLKSSSRRPYRHLARAVTANMGGTGDLSSRWTSALRKQHNQGRPEQPLWKCHVCGREISKDFDAWKWHVRGDPDSHPGLPTDDDALRATFDSHPAYSIAKPRNDGQKTLKRAVADIDLSGAVEKGVEQKDDSQDDGGQARVFKKSRSPPASLDQQQASRSSAAAATAATTTPTNRSRSQQVDETFERGQRNTSGRQLWSEGNHSQSPKPAQGRAVAVNPNISNRPGRTMQHRTPRPTTPHAQPTPLDDGSSPMVLQPETKPISQDQLVAEVKGIYAGLVMVETKCIEVDNAQSNNSDSNAKLNNDQWQALIALHRTLLHEHHDFFLASQHPSASPPLRRLASKYAMPARMWRHGIHSFLELLRHRLPASLEHMLTFLYLAYSMMALLYETVPDFEDTWIECLGDLGRYRMAIEDDSVHDREVWTRVSRHWYSKASDKSPTTGRLYHHLAILARPNALQQLYFYTKSLCVPIPFTSAKESIMTLFDLVLSNNPNRLAPIDASFVRVHAILFSGQSPDRLQQSVEEVVGNLDGHISRCTKGWLETGYYMAIALQCSLLEYGADTNVLMKVMSQRPQDGDVTMDGSSNSEAPVTNTFKLALSFTVKVIEIVIRRWGDTNTLPFLHTTLVFMAHMTRYPGAMTHLEGVFPWKLTSLMLNSLLVSCEPEYQVNGDFTCPEKDQLPRPLPEDFAMRGLVYTEDYFPKDWFINTKIDEDEKLFELPSMMETRKERILSLGYRLSATRNWLTWDESTKQFSVAKKYDMEVDYVPL